MDKTKCFVSRSFFSLDERPKINICHMVSKEHPEVIEGRQRLISVGVLDSEEAAEDSSVVHDDDALVKEDGSGLLGASVTEEVGDMKKSLKSSSILSYMLKPSQLITQGFGNNRTSQENLFKHMCNLGSRAEWRKGKELSVIILMLRPPKINAVSSILCLWTAQ